MAQLDCARCGTANSPTARFCKDCGAPMGGTHACDECGASLTPDARFCHNCGATVRDREVPPGPGSIVDGEWDKGEGELVRRVSEQEMRGRLLDAGAERSGGGFWSTVARLGRAAVDALQGRSIIVPTGCVAAVVIDGRVRRLLPPGQQTTVAFFQGIRELWSGEHDSERTQFYLIDRRAVPVHLQVDVPGAAEGQVVTLGVTVTSRLRASASTDDAAMDALTAFLERVVRDSDAFTVHDLRAHVRPHVERAARDGARSQPAGELDVAGLQATIRRAVLHALDGTGLEVDVLVAQRASVISLDLHLGRVELPQLRSCVVTTCQGEIRLGAMFCPDCGTRQPTLVDPTEPAPPEERRLISADGQLVELDLVLRAQGERQLSDPSRVLSAVADAARRLVGEQDYAALATPAGFEALAERLSAIAQEALQALQLTLLDLTVLDCKNRNGEWLLGTRAELTRQSQELEVAREWLQLDVERITLEGEAVRVDAQKIDVDQLRLETALRRLTMEQDGAFAEAEQLRADELRRVRAETDHAYTLDDVALSDRERRDALAARESTLEVGKVQRDATTRVAVDGSQREAARTLQARDHDDALTTADQAHARELQALSQGQEVADAEDAHRRSRETGELDHQIGLEQRSLEHDHQTARANAALDTDLRRGQADTEDYELRKAQERELERLQREQDLALSGERGQMGIRQDEADRAHARQMELNRLELESDAADRAHQQTMLAAKAEGQARINESLAELDAAQIAASAMHSRALSDAEAAAMAEAAAAGGREAAAMMEQRLADKDAHGREMKELLTQLLGKEQAQRQADAERAAERERDVLQTLAANTAAVAGAKQATERERHDDVVAAHRDAQAQARSMAERSMDAMGRVAASRAAPAPGPAPAAPPRPAQPAPEASSVKPCPRCGADMPGKFCTSCGYPNG